MVSEMSLHALIRAAGLAQPSGEDVLIRAVQQDSRKIVPGDLFLAFPGVAADGRAYLDDAFARGARAALCEAQGFAGYRGKNRVVPVTGLQQKLPALLGARWPFPSGCDLYGVTGTNGKSSVTWALSEVLDRLGRHCGLSGTLGTGLSGALEDTGNTTADPCMFWQWVYDNQHRMDAIALEVSSHGLEQGRVNGLPFKVGVFTNLTRDHLDYHGSMDAYSAAKSRLFRMPGLERAVLNADDPYTGTIRGVISGDVEVLTYGLETAADILASGITLDTGGIRAELKTPWGQGCLQSRLFGKYNLGNLMAVMGALGGYYPFETLLAALSKVTNVPGRLDAHHRDGCPSVFVDYAHTPDALVNVLGAIRAHFPEGKVWTVVGCGGGRDRGKRSLMARAAIQYADYAIFTQDNPRHEDPMQILQDMTANLSDAEAGSYEVIADRRAAIGHAVGAAAQGDVIVVAGKGHETYQEINGIKHPFNDNQEVHEALWGR
jgi:UDP-N-acetylmuramoyl-L-alanyl-D-glutamate--2,6-diaminopimelate ligase